MKTILAILCCVAVAGCAAGTGALPTPHLAAARAVHGNTTSGDPTIYLFEGQPDGPLPYDGLVNVNGTLYGTTYAGGTSNGGTVFSVTPGGSEKILHSFSGSDGEYPYASLIDVGGTLYGTTYNGGTSNVGTVFSITTSGKEKVVYSFKGGNDGASPDAVLCYQGGALYGTT